jgi:hypothetical protein
MPCQLTDIQEVVRNDKTMRRLFRIYVRIVRNLKRKGLRLLKQAIGDGKAGSACDLPNLIESQHIIPGDLVQVRPLEEIRELLDSEGKTEGCSFTGEMYKYCGHNFIVLKNVEFFFNEAKQKMCKCRNTVILEGAVCSGLQRLYATKCDRNCFFFWKTDWLKRII